MPEQIPEQMESIIIENEPEGTQFYIPETGEPRPGETRYSPEKKMLGLEGMTWREFQILQQSADDLKMGREDDAVKKIASILGQETDADPKEIAGSLIASYSSGSELPNSLLVLNYVIAKLNLAEIEEVEGEEKIELARKSRPALHGALAQAYNFGMEDIQNDLEKKLKQVNDIIEENEIKFLS